MTADQGKVTAIILAAGKGTRMHSKQQKVYMNLMGKEVVAHSLDAFENSQTDEIILVVSSKDIPYVEKEIVARYQYKKVTKIIAGGKERFESVYLGLQAVKQEDKEQYVMIHDSARPFLTSDQINFCIGELKKYKACVMGMPVKDTIRVVDEGEYGIKALDRSSLWLMQTPQCFVYQEILAAFDLMIKAGDQNITDDVMVMERYGNRKVKMVPGGYHNIKITTPEDMVMGEAILRKRQEILYEE